MVATGTRLPFDSAQGKVFAKPGMVASYDTFNNRITQAEALGGYLEVKPGQFYIFDLAVNNAVVPLTGILPVFNDLANISAFLQEDAAPLSRGSMRSVAMGTLHRQPKSE